MRDRLELFAPAKVNLYLEITGKRPDGYHLLESLVVFVDFGDRLSVQLQTDGILSCTVNGPFARDVAHLPEGNNIVLRAAEQLRQSGKTGLGASMVLEKHLPVAAGIGGGSSDAAAALNALNHLWHCAHTTRSLAAIGLELGADIPVCLQAPRPMHMTGIGEQLTSVSLPALPIVLVNPGVGVATGDIFRRIAPPFLAATGWENLAEPGQEACIEALRHRRNDLHPAAERLCPEIGDVLSALHASKGCEIARMSGSGATCFGIFESLEAAQKAASVLRKTHPHWWVQPCRTLTSEDSTTAPLNTPLPNMAHTSL